MKHHYHRHTIRREQQPHAGHAAAIERTLRILDQLATAKRSRELSTRNHPGTRKGEE
jgi:hypothetical protein